MSAISVAMAERDADGMRPVVTTGERPSSGRYSRPRVRRPGVAVSSDATTETWWGSDRVPEPGMGALSVTADPSTPTPAPAPVARPAAARTSARRSRRAPGAFDPFVVYRESGEATLRERLSSLGVEQLKDIIAEHAMDYDKLAMRWRTPSKLQDRIVERVKALTTKGDAFR